MLTLFKCHLGICSRRRQTSAGRRDPGVPRLLRSGRDGRVRQPLPETEEGTAASGRGPPRPLGLRHAFPPDPAGAYPAVLPAARSEFRPTRPPSKREASVDPAARASVSGQGQDGLRGRDARPRETSEVSEPKVSDGGVYHGES